MEEHIASLDKTKSIAASFAKSAKPGGCYCLIGELGAGKTEFARAFIQALAGDVTVASPTYNIVQTYDPSIYHFDLYRIEDESELEEIGLEEALEVGICLIEWPQIAQDLLPENAKWIEIEILDEGERKIKIS